jgi:pimeloyl-ACP methyl ester carboxylesterase
MLNLEHVVLAGHSMGGAIAQAIGVRQPSNLAGLILIGTGASLPVNPTILDGLQADFSGTVELIMKFAWHKESNPTPKKQATKRMLNTPREVVLADYAACNQFDLSNQLEQIQVPTLVIGSADDKMTPLTYSQYLAERIPNAQLVVIEQAGHYLMVEKTAEVTAAILNFLKP